MTQEGYIGKWTTAGIVIGIVLVASLKTWHTWQENVSAAIMILVVATPCLAIVAYEERLKASLMPKAKSGCLLYLVGMVIGLITQWGFRAVVDEARPGALFEKSTYKVWVYAHVYSGDEKVTNFRIPALVSAEWEEVATGQDSEG